MDCKKLRFLTLKVLAAQEDRGAPFDYGRLKATEEEIDEAVRFLHRTGLIKGVFYADDRPYSLNGVCLTELGREYLNKKSVFGRIKSFFRALKGWIRLPF